MNGKGYASTAWTQSPRPEDIQILGKEQEQEQEGEDPTYEHQGIGQCVLFSILPSLFTAGHGDYRLAESTHTRPPCDHPISMWEPTIQRNHASPTSQVRKTLQVLYESG